MLVADLMTAPVVTIDLEATLREAVERMLEHGIGSVVVTDGGNHVGIVTETDVLIAGYRARRPFREIPVADVASRPLLTVQPDATVRTAVERMREEGVKKLGVADGLDLVGILTHEDLVHGQPLLLREAIQHEERRTEWEPGSE